MALDLRTEFRAELSIKLGLEMGIECVVKWVAKWIRIGNRLEGSVTRVLAGVTQEHFFFECQRKCTPISFIECQRECSGIKSNLTAIATLRQ